MKEKEENNEIFDMKEKEENNEMKKTMKWKKMMNYLI